MKSTIPVIFEKKVLSSKTLWERKESHYSFLFPFFYFDRIWFNFGASLSRFILSSSEMSFFTLFWGIASPSSTSFRRYKSCFTSHSGHTKTSSIIQWDHLKAQWSIFSFISNLWAMNSIGSEWKSTFLSLERSILSKIKGFGYFHSTCFPTVCPILNIN